MHFVCGSSSRGNGREREPEKKFGFYHFDMSGKQSKCNGPKNQHGATSCKTKWMYTNQIVYMHLWAFGFIERVLQGANRFYFVFEIGGIFFNWIFLVIKREMIIQLNLNFLFNRLGWPVTNFLRLQIKNYRSPSRSVRLVAGAVSSVSFRPNLIVARCRSVCSFFLCPHSFDN